MISVTTGSPVAFLASNNNSNINDEQFCKNVLIANNHLSMFRHATIYCKYDKDYWNRHIVDLSLIHI